ncbi:hypothetical protein [Mangrovihabitans endophyticus]|uniref:Uncharacterized protein n=1 Tax=Mangrovihabitans endophyticus TaxID=1751298 RepID=A0A8J3C438_9ACTN|nr:hypothetical protein [Mangrovihabitans endophyticus]GGL05429.1 hypothetical protein GCM10012284_44850 [Mangrovihabitans endophyticus]
MSEQGGWPPAAAPPPGWRPQPPTLLSSQAARPTYREPFPVRGPQLTAGVGAALAWFALFGMLGRDLLTYAWWTVAAAISAWIVATMLMILGDRGVATGIALTAAGGLSIATAVVAVRWITTNDWPLW